MAKVTAAEETLTVSITVTDPTTKISGTGYTRNKANKDLRRKLEIYNDLKDEVYSRIGKEFYRLRNSQEPEDFMVLNAENSYILKARLHPQDPSVGLEILCFDLAPGRELGASAAELEETAPPVETAV